MDLMMWSFCHLQEQSETWIRFMQSSQKVSPDRIERLQQGRPAQRIMCVSTRNLLCTNHESARLQVEGVSFAMEKLARLLPAEAHPH